jgi:hypothetical protein
MKVTSNLSFLLCMIGSIAMPVVEASLHGLELKRSSASTKRTAKNQKAFEVPMHQQRRGLQTAEELCEAFLETLYGPNSGCTCTEEEPSQECLDSITENGVNDGSQTAEELCEAFLEPLYGPNSGCTCTEEGFSQECLGEPGSGGSQTEEELCEAFLEALYGPNSGCTCSDELPSQECSDFIAENCLICDTLEGEEACLLFFDEEAIVAASAASPATASVDIECTTYKSGPFADDTLCGIENLEDNTCTFTINEKECNSCTVIDCSEETDYDIDCSNVIAGEIWNLCTDEIPETSPFIAWGTNDRFEELTCNPKDSGSGGVAASTHVLSLFGLVIVACFL